MKMRVIQKLGNKKVEARQSALLALCRNLGLADSWKRELVEIFATLFADEGFVTALKSEGFITIPIGLIPPRALCRLQS